MAERKLRQIKVVRQIAVGFVVVSAIAGLIFPAAAAEISRSYAVSWFHLAQYFGGDSDCPNGLNPPSVEFYRRDLLLIHPKALVASVLKNFPGEDSDQPWLPLVPVRGNGKDNVYNNPTTVPDSHMKEVQGHFAYGFNLDGKGADDPHAFEDPETHERGVDNQLYRVTGCVRSYRAGPPPDRPSSPAQWWDNSRDLAPAWVITIKAEQPGDGPVQVIFDRALEPAVRDASGNTRADMRFHIDPDRRAHNVLKGTLKHGKITTEPAALRLIADPFVQPEFDFTQAHLRLEIHADGSLRGILGAYQPWLPFYSNIAVRGVSHEYSTSMDVPALYYALRRAADADPDPKTGENRAISTAYLVEAVPVFAITAASVKTAARKAGS